MMIRRMVARGARRAAKNTAGVYEFDTRDLDGLRPTLAPATTSIARASVPPTAPGTASSSVTAPFLLAASAARDAVVADDDQVEPTDEDDVVDGNGGDPGTATRMSLTQPPLGSTQMSSWPYSCAVVTARPAIAQARVAELEHEANALRVELAAKAFAIDAANTEVRYWKSMYRGLRLQQVGDVVANELTQQRVGSAEVIQFAAQAAVAAVATVPDDTQLAHPGAVDVGRHAAAWVIASYAAAGPARNDETDLDRARDRHVMRRHRGRRW